MCGISGFFSPNKQEIKRELLINFSKVLNHRGPDNVGIYYDNYVGLAHNRLSILDLSENGESAFF